jgi:peptidoglycan/LPS O-acetylase OafA/YrhL
MAVALDALPTARKSRGRIPSLDGLRALSIALVLFAHSTGTRFFPSFVFAREQLGNLGVRIFFVISGYLITSILLDEMQETGSISLKWFYIRRALRIFPAVYAYIAVIIILYATGWLVHFPAGHSFPLSITHFVRALTYTINYTEPRPWSVAHLWSLSVEEQFYLLWPAVLLLSGRSRGMKIAACVMIVSPLFRVLPPYFFPSAPVQWYGGITFQANADALAAGCLLAGAKNWLASKPGYMAFLRSRAFLLMPVAIVAAFTLQTLTVVPFSHPVMNIAIALCIDRSVRFESDALGRVLNWKPIVFIGVLSYSLYLWQELFLHYGYVSASPLTWFPINLLCVIPAALASYYLVEKPFLNWRKRIERAYAPAVRRVHA